MGPRPRKANLRDRSSEVATNVSDDQRQVPNEGHSWQAHGSEPPRRLVVVYSERELQMTIEFLPSTTISKAKEIGARNLLEYLRAQPDAPPDLTIDDDCTDIFPGMI